MLKSHTKTTDCLSEGKNSLHKSSTKQYLAVSYHATLFSSFTGVFSFIYSKNLYINWMMMTTMKEDV